MILRFVDREKANHRVSVMCRVLKVSRSGYYAWRDRKPAKRAVQDAIASVITTLPEQLRRSLAWDQGAEMAQHARLRVETGLELYFCDPQSPWQRGTNENTNGLLRQYFPK